MAAKRLKDGGLVAILADGMGGAAGGEIASSLAVQSVVANLDPFAEDIETELYSQIGAANNAIAKAVRQDESLSGMGTTLVICSIVDSMLRWISVGDSPLYLVRDEKCRRLNLDESYGGHLDRLAEAKEISVEEAKSSRRRHQLMNVVMGDGEITVNDCEADGFKLENNDVLLLASDGLQTVADEQLAEIVEEEKKGGAKHLANQLMDAVAQVDLPNQDNSSVIVMIISNGEEE